MTISIALAAAVLTLADPSGTARAVPADSCAKPQVQLRLLAGRQPPSLAAAERLFAFRPRTIGGRPFRIYVTREARLVHRSLRLVYRSAAGHRYALSQSLAWESAERFDAFVRDVAERDPCGSRASIVRLADGSSALLIEAEDRRVLDFRSGNVAFQLVGPPEAFSRARVFALANSLVRGP
jgi:hypothetical protein